MNLFGFQQTREYLRDFISLFFPRNCIFCKTNLVNQESIICTRCRLVLPITNFHLDPVNPLKKKFAYEPKITFVSAYLYFNQGGIAQRLIHSLKYNEETEVGLLMGRWYGEELKSAGVMADCIIPVPIHRSKLLHRGYNQADFFADGLGEVLGIPVEKTWVQRILATSSQTRKSKTERWQNVTDIYSSPDPEKFINKKVLIVDDVLTTGATIGSLAALIISHQAREVGVVTIAAGA